MIPISDPKLAKSANNMRELALTGDKHALDLLIEMHRLDARRIAMVEAHRMLTAAVETKKGRG